MFLLGKEVDPPLDQSCPLPRGVSRLLNGFIDVLGGINVEWTAEEAHARVAGYALPMRSGARAVPAHRDARATLRRMSDIEDPAVEDAIAFLRGHLSGLLRFDADVRPVKVVVGLDGRLILPAMVAMLRSLDTTLYLPDEEDTSMQMQVSLEEFQESGEHGKHCDRWRIYHGDPPDVRWAIATVDAVRFDGLFIDGEALTRPNPLAALEASICKRLNAERMEQIRVACQRHVEIGIEKPIVVGVDPYGFDVRGTFEVYRLESPSEMRSERDALTALDELAS